MTGRKYQKLDNENLDQEIQATLQKKFAVPEHVEDAKQAAFAKIRAMEQQTDDEKENKRVCMEERSRKKKKRILKTFAGIAAAAACFSGVCIVNPVLAAQIPLIGHVFEQIGDSLGFSGDYSKYAVQLVTEETADEGKESEEANADTKAEGYRVAKDGMTMTLSEVYCNDAALNISVLMEFDEAYKDITLIDQWGEPVLEVGGYSQIKFSFKDEADPVNITLNGAFVDDKTYAGVIRYEFTEETPEEFTADLIIKGVQGVKKDYELPKMPEEIRDEYEKSMKEAGLGLTDEEYAAFTEEEKEIEHQLFNAMWNAYYEVYPEAAKRPNKYEYWWIDEEWAFTLDLMKNDQDTEVIEINDKDENGLGLSEVIKTPFEILLKDNVNTDYFTTILDANGDPLDMGRFSEVYALGKHDVSKVDIYICDYIEYMDELKGYYWKAEAQRDPKRGENYKKILDERALYHKELKFE